MKAARIYLDPKLPAAQALARGQALLESVGPDRPVLLYGVALSGAAVALGAYQHAPHALNRPALEALAVPLLRRRSGGAAVWASEGLLYFALGLANASVLMACPPGKILNRNVRGLLAGVRGLAVPAHYFGRDFVSFATAPGAYVGWDEAEDGRVLVEFFVALDAGFTLPEGMSGYPQPIEPPLRGKLPTTLRAAGANPQSATHVLEQLAAGYGSAFALDLVPGEPSAAELARASELRAQLGVEWSDGADLAWSDPHEEAIGFLSAGVRLDARGAFAAVRSGGDLYQHHACVRELEARLLGTLPDAERIGAALDAVYAMRPGRIEGVRSLNTIRAALLQAAQRASRS